MAISGLGIKKVNHSIRLPEISLKYVLIDFITYLTLNQICSLEGYLLNNKQLRVRTIRNSRTSFFFATAMQSTIKE